MQGAAVLRLGQIQCARQRRQKQQRRQLLPDRCRGLYLAVAGSLLFYWNVLMRFMENSSSWHRVQPTAAVWQVLAVLVFLAALARALHIPQPDNGKTLCAAGLAAFALGLCWQLPQCFALLAGGMGLAVMPEFFAGLGLCCVGGIGGVCAAACLNRQS